MNLNNILNNTIVRRFLTIDQLAELLIMELERDIQKFRSKLVNISGDFYLRDSQIEKDEKEWLYPQMIETITKIKNSIIICFLQLICHI